jgi:hypothetical protein
MIICFYRLKVNLLYVLISTVKIGPFRVPYYIYMWLILKSPLVVLWSSLGSIAAAVFQYLPP